MIIENSNESSYYRITIDGKLDAHWGEWFNDYMDSINISESELNWTELTVRVPDQAALRAVLNRIWDLNLVLTSVVRISEYESKK